MFLQAIQTSNFITLNILFTILQRLCVGILNQRVEKLSTIEA